MHTTPALDDDTDDGGNEHEADRSGRDLLRRSRADTCLRRCDRGAIELRPLANLLNTIGATLRPKVFCVGELADQGVGHPDFGLYGAKQVQRGRPREGQVPERGVVEVKSSHDDMQAGAVREQVGRYWSRYRLVLVTNLREFVLVGEDAEGHEATLEAFRLAGSEAVFERRLQTPRAFARRSARDWASTCAVHCRTVPRWPSQRTWHGCSRPMHATDSRGSRRRATRPPSRRCVRRSKRPSGCASRVRRCALLSLDLGADAVLRRVLRLGAVGACRGGV